MRVSYGLEKDKKKLLNHPMVQNAYNRNKLEWINFKKTL